LEKLHGRLWHTTHPHRFKAILNSGAILPAPDLLDNERWKTSQGKDSYSYVRFLGGVSLFDFDQFDPESYSEKYPSCSWAYFVPHHLAWGCAVWIEIDREQIAIRFISGANLLAKQKAEQAFRHAIMPHIEAAHLGLIPVAAFKQAFLVRKEDNEFHTIDCIR
jgi:hypothetical protein